MKKTVAIMMWTMAVAVFGPAGVAEATGPVAPFVSLSITPDELDLGTVPFAGLWDSPASLKVLVQSNCSHGPILVSTTPLTSWQHRSVSADRIFVKSKATNGFVAMQKPVAVSEPQNGSHEIELSFRVQGEMDLAGQYSGTLTFTIMPSSLPPEK